MRHLEIKNTLAGAKGGGSKPKPPVLNPPQIGDFSVAASYSYSESVDLISDGPIEGLTNSNGYILNPSSYLQGVYLNDVAVETTNDGFVGNAEIEVSQPLSGNGASMGCFTGVINNGFDKIETYNEGMFDYAPAGNGTDTETTLSQTSENILISVLNQGNRRVGKIWIEEDIKEREFACLNLEDASGFTGVAVYYNSKNYKPVYYSFGNNINYYNITDGPETSSVDEALDRHIYGTKDPPYKDDNGEWVPAQYPKTIKNYLINNGIAAGATFFWEKQCQDVSLNNTFYMEMCLQSSDIDESLDKANTLGKKREKFISGINQLADINVTGDRGGGDLSSVYLRERLVDLGYDLTINTEDGSFDPITFTSIKAFIKKTLKGKTRIDISENIIFPHLFIAHDENQIIEGYNATEHEYLFQNPDFIEALVYGGSYPKGDTFYFGGLYYIVISNSITAPTSGDLSVFVEGLLTSDPPQIQTTKGKDVLSKVVFEPISKIENIADSLGFRMNLLIPTLDEDGLWNGTVKGFYLEMLSVEIVASNTSYNTLLSKREIEHKKEIYGIGVFDVSLRSAIIGSSKYNYSNILMEFRDGSQSQEPLGYFKNIYIDHFYNSTLLGPFNIEGALGEGGGGNLSQTVEGVQRLKEGNTNAQNLKLNSDGSPPLNFGKNSVPEMDNSFLEAFEEGSRDIRDAGSIKSFSEWNTTKEDRNERAQPVKHIIENPNVSSCFITISIQSLVDTAEDTNYLGGDLGAKLPAPLNIRIETGLIDNAGNETIYSEKFFQIMALVESPNYMDIGNPDFVDTNSADIKDIRELERNVEGFAEGGIKKPFVLPPIPTNKSSLNTETKEDQREKRYVKITKLSTETNSTLIRKDVSLTKVTEIIESQCTYPFSSIVGTKVDSRVFNDIPKRTYRAKFKKVRIPSNYSATFLNGKDKRYYKTRNEFNDTLEASRQVYYDDWDGTFKFGWTDNPAWILYDMLTSTRYGLGEQVSEEQVNKWELYKIGRFCDAVDEYGVFIGVDDDRGGVEPRFSCNIQFNEGTKIFDAINSIAAIFRGIVYFQNSTISFLDDRIKSPIGLFTNSNVADGFFSYSSYKRDEKFNAVEINYRDRNDNYKNKIEYVENQQDIIDRGLFKKEIVAAGITSKAMARRAAKHVMYQTTKENETVTFTAGTEVLLCKPGDLIIIEDDLKTLRSNIGRVLEANQDDYSIRTSEVFDVNEYNKSVTVYLPTGNRQKSDLDEIALTKRVRVGDFSIGGTVSPPFTDYFVDNYKFDGYAQGYQLTGGSDEAGLYEQYPIYIGDGEDKPIMWFSTGATGWVFSTGKAFADDDNYNLFITSTGARTASLKSLNDDKAFSSNLYNYVSAQPDKRGLLQTSLTGRFGGNLSQFGGIAEREINIDGNPQIRDFNVTGWGGLEGIQSKSFGDIIYIDQNDVNAELIQFIPEGSTYRFQSKDATDQVYKILSIREEDNHSYNVVASKYDSGKYEEIENDINTPDEENTYGYNKNNFFINDINYISLEPPEPSLELNYSVNLGGTTGYYLSGDWDPVDGATGYYVYYDLPNLLIDREETTTDTNSVLSGLSYIGNYTIKVQALANVFDNTNLNLRYDDSSVSSATEYVSGEGFGDLPETTSVNGGIII